MDKEEHIFTCLGEEGTEVAQDVSKILRFGLHDRNVLNPTGPTNQERLVSELNDLLGVVEMLVSIGLIPQDWQSDEKKATKKKKVCDFMDYAKKVGTIVDGYSISASQARTDLIHKLNQDLEPPLTLQNPEIKDKEESQRIGTLRFREKILYPILCFFGFHKNSRSQQVFKDSLEDKEFVVAWKCCDRCFKPKLIHILQ